MSSYLIFAACSLLAGAGIPLIGVLNSGIARGVGNPFSATAVMFAMAATVAFGFTLPLYGHPTLAQLGSAPPISYGAGLLIGFYGLVVVYHLDGVPLEKVSAFLEQPTSLANSPDGHRR